MKFNVRAFFRRLIQLFSKAEKALLQIEDLLPDALNVVQVIATLTPTRADDEILEVAREYSAGPVVLAQLHNGQREEALRTLARIALQSKVRLNLKDSIANAAIELAYTVHKANQ